MTFSEKPEVVLAHPGSVLIETRLFEKPEPREERVERPIIAWELGFDQDIREWSLHPWVMQGFSAVRWEWSSSIEDVDVVLQQTPVTGPHEVARYTIDKDGTWTKVEDDEDQEEAEAI